MAIYHLHVKVIGRKAGSSAVASAAYRSASRMRDEWIDRNHDFSAKRGVVHSEVLLPDRAPAQWRDRERLWNDVEAFEVRKDAQLAREVEFAIPREMSKAQGIELARDFVQSEFVDRGMIADLNVHWDIGEDGLAKPHAHVMLTLRSVDENGFGQKVREWNGTELVERWRERWAELANERLAELDIDARIDHRSFEEQSIALEPQSQIGAPAQRIAGKGIEVAADVADRAQVHRDIARENGARIIADPSIALDAMTHQQSTFTRRDMARFAHRHSDGIEQFNDVMGAIESAPDLVELGSDGRGEDRFTANSMIEAERRLHHVAAMMAERERHAVNDVDRDVALAHAASRSLALSAEQVDALAHITDGTDLGVVIGYAGTGKSAMLGAAKEAWEAAGYQVRGVALSGIAAENLQNGSGIASRTIASMEHGWEQGRDFLTSRDILVLDEAGMVGTRQLERVLSHAAEAGAKVVLIGDPQQLQSIEAGAAFRSIHERHGGAEIGTVRRQYIDWQREATKDLATGKVSTAIDAYDRHGMVHEAPTRAEARENLVERWDRELIGGRNPIETTAQRQRNAPATPTASPQEDHDAMQRRARTDALKRHARAMDAIFSASDPGGQVSAARSRELTDARKAFEDVRPHGWRDAEAAYSKDPELAREAASGRINRAVRALQLETELRIDPNRRADRFVENWQKLERTSKHQYSEGDMSGYRATRSAMVNMAKNLERDAQLESLLANRKAELGIHFETGRSLGQALAFTHGIELGRGRNIGI